jgi:hypothetical protein
MDLWFFPTANLLVNTFLRSIIVILIIVFGFKASWYSAYVGAVIHDGVSLILIRNMI